MLASSFNWFCFIHSLEAYYCIDSFKTVGNSPELPSFNRFFPKLGRFIRTNHRFTRNEPPVLPSSGLPLGHKAYKGNDLLKPLVYIINLLASHMCNSDNGLECCVSFLSELLHLAVFPSIHHWPLGNLSRLWETFELKQLKICPFPASTGFFRIWPVANLLPFIWTG